MPRIDPLQLLRILSVLLSPSGGIKSQEEVPRLASLMTKFSKKLVSKCIYVSILKATEPDLLVMWMTAGGWDLIYNWLNDGVQAGNWPLVSELVELLLICPVDIERLKTNRCPKLIKTLSKNPDATESVRQIAADIVKKWLMVVNEVLTKQKDEAPEESETECQQTVAEDGSVQIATIEEQSDDKMDAVDNQLPVYRIIIRDGKEVLTEVSNKDRSKGLGAGLDIVESTASDNLTDIKPDKKLVSPEKSVNKQNLKVKKVVELNVARKISKGDRLSDASEASSSNSDKLDLDRDKVINRSKSDPAKDRRKDKMRQIRKDPDGDMFFESKPCETKLNDKVKSKKVTGKEDSVKGKNSDKVKSGSKSASNSGSNNDSATNAVLNKFPSTPDISKLGKIPKKIKTEKKEVGDKKDKSDSSDKKEKEGAKTAIKIEKDDVKTVKKSVDVKKLPAPPPPKPERDSKKYNISVEARKVPPGENRPKTVKTFNSKFRSTGLEEELPPPPQPKIAKKNVPLATSPITTDKKPLKRTSPPKETPPPEKKLKSETTNAELLKGLSSPAASSPEKDTTSVKLSTPPPPVSKPKCLQ